MDDVAGSAELDQVTNSLVRMAVERRRKIKALEEQTAQEKRLLADEEQAIIDAWKVTGTDLGRVGIEEEDGSKVRVTVSIRDVHGVNVKGEDKGRLLEWLRQRGDAELIREDVAPSTIKKHVLELEALGERLPEFIRVWHGRQLGYTTRRG